MAMTKIKGLQMWCKKMAEGYPLVDIVNFTTAWRDGLAFCAIIHRFRPDLIDFHSLSPENVFENCKMAFEIAERELSIPAFLEAEDMVRLKVPDKLSIITYVSQYYNYLHALPQLGGPEVKGKVSTKGASGTKRPTDSDTSQAPITKKATTESKENLAPATERSTAGSDKCTICQSHVYLVERHMEGGKLYHRSCFRHSELSPANKVLTRSPFLSPSLSFDTQSSTSLNVDKKVSQVEKSSKITNSDKQFGTESIRVTSGTSSISKKTENVGLKHPLTELSRDDTKKFKMQPKLLFGDDKSKNVSATKNSPITNENVYTKNSDSGKSVPFSNKVASNWEKRPEDVQLSKNTVELSKDAQSEHQQKDIIRSDTPKSTLTTAHTPASPLTVKKNILETKSTAVISKTSNTSLPSHSDSDTVQSKYKLAGTKDTQKSSNESELDTILSKTKALPSVQNLQQMFSKSDLDLNNPIKPSHPVPRPRSGTLRSVSEEQSNVASLTKSASDEKHKDVSPKAAPRKSVLETSVITAAPNRLEIPAKSKKSVSANSCSVKTETPKLSTVDVPPPLPKSAPPPFSIQINSGEITSVAGDKDLKKPSADRLFQETKLSLHPVKHTEDQKFSVTNTSRNLNQENGSSKTSSVQVSLKTNQTGSSNANDGKILSGLLSTLAGIRGQMSSSPGPVNHSLQSTASDTALTVDDKVKTGNVITPPKTLQNTSATTSTPAKLLHSLSQTESSSVSRVVIDSTKNHTDVEGYHAKSKTEKSVVTQGQNDSNSSVKVFSTIQAPNKIQEPVSSFKPTHSESGTKSTAISNHKTRTEFKHSRPEKANNDSNSALSHNVDAQNKEQGISKVQSQKINENSDIKSAGRNVLNFKSSEKKSECKDVKNDSKQSSATAESKGPSYNRNTALSSSRDDHLDINSIKLRVVMPERKVVQEPRTPVYDVKLKKVDVIKGDVKWDNVPDMPSGSLHASEKNINKNVSFDVTPGEKIESPRTGAAFAQKSPGLTTKESHSSLENSQKTEILDELPQWKKDIEEKKNKFRSQSESEMNQTKYQKGIDDKKTETLSEKKHDIGNKMKTPEIHNTSEGVLSSHSDIKSVEKDSVTNIGSYRNNRKLSPKREHRCSGNKLDWQLEAEKRMAALAGFDMEVVEKLKELKKSDKVSSDNVVNQQNKISTMHNRSEGDISTFYNKTNSSDRKYSDRLMSGDSIVQNDKIATKSKESRMEFVLSKAKLKPIEVAISILPQDDIEGPNNDHSHTIHDRGSKGEDFRDILHQLKRVPAIESGKMDVVKTKNEIDLQRDTTTCDILPSSVFKPSQNNNVNKNNNKLITSQQNNFSELENINKLSKNWHTPLKTTGIEGSFDANGNEMKIHISELPKEKPVLLKSSQSNENKDKVKVKITTVDNNKSTVASPPSSPIAKKIIQLTKKFDFEQSSDFENSLSESTAKLTIQDKYTPPPPHLNHEMVSPNHISAIELQAQLQSIDSRLTDLELKGRKIEEAIRKVNSLEDDDDELMIEWFSVINERHDLVRKEAELVYISKEQELETEQERIEHQLRYLMSKSDECKSPEEKEEEEYLIQHKMSLVEQRNKIVDSIDENRIQYEIEDRGIEVTLKNKGLWKDSTGTLRALKGKKVANSVFYM